jgi:cytochrome c5
VSAGQDKHFQDRRFFDTFMLVLAILIAVALGIGFLANHIANATQVAHLASEKVMKEAVAQRIEPVAKVAVSGQDNSALEPPAPAAAQTQTAQADLTGEQVFQQACMACHGAGVAGAPKYGDKAAWGPRIAQGIETLHQHALHGFQGKSGVMPPKGGRADLSDKSIMNGVDYMVAAGK